MKFCMKLTNQNSNQIKYVQEFQGLKKKTKAATLPAGKLINVLLSSISKLAKGKVLLYPSNHGLLKEHYHLQS